MILGNMGRFTEVGTVPNFINVKIANVRDSSLFFQSNFSPSLGLIFYWMYHYFESYE